MKKEQTLEAIKIMQAACDGKPVQYRRRESNPIGWSGEISIQDGLAWDWSCFDYRIKPEPMEIELAISPDGRFYDPRYFNSEDQAFVKIRFREIID